MHVISNLRSALSPYSLVMNAERGFIAAELVPRLGFQFHADDQVTTATKLLSHVTKVAAL